ncbi:MAG TPA: hypothetical protein VHR66_27750 [Gemmataceae bacterium]|jgi:hypothetical protein|nr:hypothetical protein [Gemmataceae bacterium]
MNEITASNVHQFLRRFQLRGSRLRLFRVRNTSAESSAAEILLVVRQHGLDKPVRLRLVFEGVEEYRFQRRPGPGLVRLKDVQIGFFGNLTYVNFDPFPEDGPPKVMDYRASDCFVAARRVNWEIVAKAE